MKKVTKYQSTDGTTWNTEMDAYIADFRDLAVDSGGYLMQQELVDNCSVLMRILENIEITKATYDRT
jgi:hypothetical protein